MTTNDARDLTGEEIAQFKAHAESYPQTSSAWMLRVLAQLERTQAERDLFKGAMQAQDERERKAGELCGVDHGQWGCDWPAAVADVVVHLRSLIKQISDGAAK